MLANVAVRESQMVERGDILAQIDDAEAKLVKHRGQIELDTAREQAENDVNVRAAQKAWEVSNAELKRSEEAVKRFKKSVSETELDRLRLLKEQSELSIEQSELEKRIAGFTKTLKENEFELAKLRVELHKVRAPLAGMVVQINRFGLNFITNESLELLLRVHICHVHRYLRPNFIPLLFRHTHQ